MQPHSSFLPSFLPSFPFIPMVSEFFFRTHYLLPFLLFPSHFPQSPSLPSPSRVTYYAVEHSPSFHYRPSPSSSTVHYRAIGGAQLSRATPLRPPFSLLRHPHHTPRNTGLSLALIRGSGFTGVSRVSSVTCRDVCCVQPCVGVCPSAVPPPLLWCSWWMWLY